MTKRTPAADFEPPAKDPHASGTVGRIRSGLAANMVGNGITLISQIVSVPVLLSAWGVPKYGEWLVLSAFPTYVALSDLSFSTVAGNSMVMLASQGKRAEAVALGRRVWSIVTVMTVVVVMVAVAIALLFGGAFGQGAAIPVSETRIVLAALFLQVAIANQYGVLDAWYRAGGQYPLGAYMRQIGRLVEFSMLIAVVLLGAGPALAAIAFLVGSVTGFGASWIVLRRAVPWSSFRPERPHLRTFRDLLAPGIAMMAFPLGQALSVQGFSVVVASMLGTGSVVIFSATRTVSRLPVQAMGAITAAIWPELSRSVGSDRLEEARAILRRATQGALAVSLLSAITVAVFGPVVIRWWTHGIIDPPRDMLFVLLLVMVLYSVWNTLSTVCIATNRHKRLSVAYIAVTVAGMLAALALSSAFGLVGTAAALLVVEVGMVAYTLSVSLRVVGDLPGPFLRSLLDISGVVRLVKSSLRARS